MISSRCGRTCLSLCLYSCLSNVCEALLVLFAAVAWEFLLSADNTRDMTVQDISLVQAEKLLGLSSVSHMIKCVSLYTLYQTDSITFLQDIFLVQSR